MGAKLYISVCWPVDATCNWAMPEAYFNTFTGSIMLFLLVLFTGSWVVGGWVPVGIPSPWGWPGDLWSSWARGAAWSALWLENTSQERPKTNCNCIIQFRQHSKFKFTNFFIKLSFWEKFKLFSLEMHLQWHPNEAVCQGFSISGQNCHTTFLVRGSNSPFVVHQRVMHLYTVESKASPPLRR